MVTKGNKDQVTRGTEASAARKVQGDKEKFDSFKGEKRAANLAKKAPRKIKSVVEDFPFGFVGLYLTLLTFVAFVCSVLYWVVVIAFPKA